MALPFPEGECFFNRAGIHGPNSQWYQANDPADFYSNMLIEYVWNEPYEYDCRDRVFSHPRSQYVHTKADGSNTKFGAWDQISLSYGPSIWDIKQRRVHNLCLSGWRFYDRFRKGAAAESWFMHAKLPTASERWIRIDALANIRAIYLPLSQTVSEDYPELCSFLCINFAHNGIIKMWDGESQNTFNNVQCDPTFGIRAAYYQILSLDVYGLMSLLQIPRHMRSQSVYTAKLITWSHFSRLANVGITQRYEDKFDFDWIDVAKANMGLSLQWVPPKPEATPWWKNFIKNVITIAVGFVPGVGPILSVGAALFLTYLIEPDKFLQELRDQIPTADLSIELFNKFSNDTVKNREEQMKYISPEWKGLFTSSSLSLPDKESISQTAAEGADDSFVTLVTPLESIPPSEQFISNGYTLASSVRTITQEEIDADKNDEAKAEITIYPGESVDATEKEPYSMNPTEIPNKQRLFSDIDWIKEYTSLQYRVYQP